MNNINNDPEEEVSPEVLDALKKIKDTCLPSDRIWHKTYYTLLLICSFVPLFSYYVVFSDLNWDSFRYGHGLLPLDILMMRNNSIPWLLPINILICFALSFKFRLLRSSGFLAWFALILFFLLTIYIWLSGMFIFHLFLSTPS